VMVVKGWSMARGKLQRRRRRATSWCACVCSRFQSSSSHRVDHSGGGTGGLHRSALIPVLFGGPRIHTVTPTSNAPSAMILSFMHHTSPPVCSGGGVYKVQPALPYQVGKVLIYLIKY
jgi:hypothetical protein